MTINAPSNPLFAHSENKIYITGVDQYLDCEYTITTNGSAKIYTNRVYAYNGNCEVDISELLKMFYYRIEQQLPISETKIIDGSLPLNGGELKIKFSDYSLNEEEIEYKVVNGALQVGESFDPNENQFLNQIQISFAGFPSDVTQWLDGDIVRSNLSPFPVIKKCKGVYLMWLNKYGAYDSYLFDGHSELEIDSSDVEKFRGYSLGKKSNRVIKIRANVIETLKLLTVQKVSTQITAKKLSEAILSIKESPEVYIFRVKDKKYTSGGDFNIDFNEDFLIGSTTVIEGEFMKVKSVSGSNKIEYRYNTTQFSFDITLPDERNIKAI